MRHHEPAICLRVTDYSETSQVVHFLTRGVGLVHLIAKGTKRPKSKSGGAIDLLAEGDLVFSAQSSSALGTLMEFAESVSHTPLRRDAARLHAALYLVEITGAMLAEADPHPEVFDLLHNALARLAQPEAPVPAVLAYFQWRLLKHVGLLGDLTVCVGCGEPVARMGRGREDVYFSSAQGGLLCGGCEVTAVEKYQLDRNALTGLAALAAAQAGKKVALPDHQARSVSRLLNYHIAQQLGKPPRTARYVIGG